MLQGARAARWSITVIGSSLGISATGCQRPEQQAPAVPAPKNEVTIAEPSATSTSDTAAAPRACERSFEQAWPRLRRSMEARDLDSLVSARHGIFVIDNPGAFVVPHHYERAAAAIEEIPALRPENYEFDCPQLQHGAQPQYSCDDESWSAEGCWHSQNPEFSVARHYDMALRYEVLPAERAGEREPAMAVDALIDQGIYSTAATLGYYFGRLDCRWYLLAIDAVTPCSA